jgi:microcystin-dependent protein
MKSKHIIIGLVVILIVLFFVQNKEHAGSVSTQTLSNEAIQNIAKVYADTTTTASFNNLNVTGKSNIIPTGVIVAFNGTTAPKNWAICDGTQGTPDLRSRFIVGVGQGKDASNNNLTNRTLADKGGEENVALTLKEIPTHKHDLEVWGAAGGEPETNKKWTLKLTDRQEDNYKSWENLGSRDDNPGAPPVRITHTGGDNTITTVSGYNANSQETWATKPHNNMPPFYALMYIMKI